MKIHQIGLGFAAGGLLLSGGAAIAQSSPSASAAPTTTLDEVVVTASKREEKVHDVAMSITAVSGDDLLQRQATGYNDLAAEVPGLAIEAVDAGRNRIILRGENAGSPGATIATTIDDIPFFMSGAQANGAFFSANVDTYDLKRVEVLRGPQGTLYGATSEGGLIKYVTNPPDLTQVVGAASIGGETVDGGQSAGSAKGLINLPFWDHKAALRVSAVEEELPGWINNPTTGQSDANHGQKYSLRGSLLIEPVSELTIRLTAFNQGLDLHGDNSVEVIGAAATPATPPSNQFDLANGFTHGTFIPDHIIHRLEYYALNIEYAFKAATLLSATSYGKIGERFNPDLTNDNLAPGATYGAALGGAFYGQPIGIVANQYEYVHKFNQELRLTSNPGTTLFGNAFDWLVGGFYTREATLLSQPYNALSSANPPTVLAPEFGGASVPAYYKETAFFADVTYHFSPAFDVELGGRNTLTQQSSQVTTDGLLYGQINASTVFPAIYSSETSNTWSIAPRWHVNPDVMIYARYATGFRPGGPNLPTPTLATPPSFLHDTTRNYEIGLRADVFGRLLTIDVAAFDIDWKDIQIISLVNTPSGPVGINGNSGSGKSSGLEWNFLWRPTQGLSVQLLGAYTNAHLTTDAPGLGAFSGDKLPYVPDVSGALNIDYKWPAFGSFAGFVGGSWIYSGTQYSNFSSNQGVIESHAKLPTYNALDLRGGIDSGRYSAELYARNVNNSRGITEYMNQGGRNQTGLATIIQPRTIGIELGAKF